MSTYEKITCDHHSSFAHVLNAFERMRKEFDQSFRELFGGGKGTLELVEDEWYITTDHPATKENYISFLAFATGDKMQVLKQYPEWEIHARIPKREHGKLFWYSTSKGFFYQLI